ncbi:hepatoma-derived growth factor-related protein 2-like isoform X1 [Panicum virgatum]|uniref:hepatoma-derived growth factor-related protein 2-like isoform X1 n=1 Tax=Panicum virgatum TaxID=38727 RepID=UPI0019D64882|nr:hepatoma-derived growth factor-related protein 2-like isoform X1 [Panicum virgatum]
MCFCGSLCKLMKSRVLGDDFGMRFFMCENYEYDPPNHYGKDRAKTPPPLCDFVQWLDTEQSQQDKDHVERQAKWAAQRRQRMLHEEQMDEKRKKDQEEIQKRIAEVECQKAEERETDRERKLERARRAKEAGPEAIRKGKYPRCTQ